MEDSSAIEAFSGLKFPKDTIEYALFEGIEQEGPHKGAPTLFVVGNVPMDVLRPYLINAYEQVYFGAGGRFDYNPETVAEVVKMQSFQVVVESPEFNLELMLRLPTLHWMLPIVWHGKPVEGTVNNMRDAHLVRNRVIVKVDTGVATYSAWLNLMFNSDYADYSADKLLIQKTK